MKNFIFNKAFFLGFACAVAATLIFNLFTLAIPEETQLRNHTNGYGFPLAFYETGGSPHFARVIVSLLIADIAIVIVYSILVGLFFSYLWRKNLRESGSAF